MCNYNNQNINTIYWEGWQLLASIFLCLMITGSYAYVWHFISFTTDNGQKKIFHSKVPIRDVILLCMEVFTRLTQQRRRRLISGLKEPKTLGQKTKLTSNGSPSGTFILIEFRKLIIRNIHRIDSNQPLHHFVTHDDLILYFSPPH